MALPDFSMRQLLEAGVHFGHQSHRWNPKMADYIFGARNNIHIIDLAQTVPLLHRALQAVSDTVAKGGRILFVGTKRQAQDGVAEAAKRSAQYFVNSRWLGGTLTNWKTISGSIKRLRHLDEVLGSGDASAYTKKEDIAIQEAQRLNIPVAAIVDTNSDPKGITYVIPGNDDAGRAISLYCDLVARAVIDGISRAQGDAGIDVGASAHPVREEIPTAPQASGFQGLAGPRGAPDDLKKLTGVSGAIEKKFNDLGIFHYWQLAELNHDTAHQIGEEVGLPSRADGWVAQAKAMTAEAE